MIKYFCSNSECENYKKVIPEGKVTYIMRDGKLVPKVQEVCKKCGRPMLYESEENNEINFISIGKFSGLSTKEKAKVLKDRARKISKKENVQEKIEYKRNQAIKKFFGE